MIHYIIFYLNIILVILCLIFIKIYDNSSYYTFTSDNFKDMLLNTINIRKINIYQNHSLLEQNMKSYMYNWIPVINDQFKSFYILFSSYGYYLPSSSHLCLKQKKKKKKKNEEDLTLCNHKKVIKFNHVNMS